MVGGKCQGPVSLSISIYMKKSTCFFSWLKILEGNSEKAEHEWKEIGICLLPVYVNVYVYINWSMSKAYSTVLTISLGEPDSKSINFPRKY